VLVNYAQADVGFLDAFSSRPGETLGSAISMTTITFEKWRPRFENILAVRTPAWTALQTCREYFKRPASTLPEGLICMLGEDWTNDIHNSVLKLIYRLTLPRVQFVKSKQKRDAYTRKALRELTTQAEHFVTNLKKMAQFEGTPGRVFVSCNHSHFIRLDLSPVLAAYQSVAEISSYFLALLEKPTYEREPDILGIGIGSSGFLDFFEVAERENLELVRLAMLAHGYPKGPAHK
jgi:hypothetical protein